MIYRVKGFSIVQRIALTVAPFPSVLVAQLCIILSKAVLVEDLGTASYWLVSRTFKAPGLTKSHTIISLATLDRQGVSEMGRRSFLMSSTGCFLGSGVTSAHFHMLGNCSWNDLLMMVVTGKARRSASSFKIQFEMPCGSRGLWWIEL